MDNKKKIIIHQIKNRNSINKKQTGGEEEGLFSSIADEARGALGKVVDSAKEVVDEVVDNVETLNESKNVRKLVDEAKAKGISDDNIGKTICEVYTDTPYCDTNSESFKEGNWLNTTKKFSPKKINLLESKLQAQEPLKDDEEDLIDKFKHIGCGDLEDKIETLKTELASLKQEQQTKEQALQTELQNLQNELQQKQQKQQTQQAKEEKQQTQIQNLQNELQNLQNDLQQKQKNTAILNTKLESLKMENANIRTEESNILQQQQENTNVIQGQLENANKKIEELQTELNSIDSTRESLEKEIRESSQKEIEKLIEEQKTKLKSAEEKEAQAETNIADTKTIKEETEIIKAQIKREQVEIEKNLNETATKNSDADAKLSEAEIKLQQAIAEAKRIIEEAKTDSISAKNNIAIDITQDLQDKINKLDLDTGQLDGIVQQKTWDYNKNNFLDNIGKLAEKDADIAKNNSTYYKIISKMQDIENLKIRITNGLNTKNHQILKTKILSVFKELTDFINKKYESQEERIALIKDINTLEEWIKLYFDVTTNIKAHINLAGFDGQIKNPNIKKFIKDFTELRDTIFDLVSNYNNNIQDIDLDKFRIDKEKQESIKTNMKVLNNSFNKLKDENNQELFPEIVELLKTIFKELEYENLKILEDYLINKTFNNLKQINDDQKKKIEEINKQTGVMKETYENQIETLEKKQADEIEKNNKQTGVMIETYENQIETLEKENQNLEEINNQLKITNKINEKEKEQNANLIKTKNDEIKKLKSELQPKIEDTPPTAVEDESDKEARLAADAEVPAGDPAVEEKAAVNKVTVDEAVAAVPAGDPAVVSEPAVVAAAPAEAVVEPTP